MGRVLRQAQTLLRAGDPAILRSWPRPALDREECNPPGQRGPAWYGAGAMRAHLETVIVFSLAPTPDGSKVDEIVSIG